MDEMIAIRNLTKRFGAIAAVDDVSFTVRRGEVLGFLGPNGAGKSTTMKMLAGFLAPTSGSAAVCGFDVQERPIEAKSQLGYLPEGAPAYPDMTPRGFLGFVAAIRGFDGAERAKRIDSAVERANLQDVLEQPIDTLSKGFKRRVGLAQALLHDPKVLVLDEPTDGLDPNQKYEVRRLIEAMAADKAIVVSTHILEEVEAACTRVIIIAGGRVVADGTPAELSARDPIHNAVLIRLDPAAVEAARRKLGGLAGVKSVETIDGGAALLVHPADGRPLITEIGALVRSEPWRVSEISVAHGRLETVFRHITGGIRPAAAGGMTNSAAAA
jgi:ABC-2 type transport system ATP-binding protein